MTLDPTMTKAIQAAYNNAEYSFVGNTTAVTGVGGQNLSARDFAHSAFVGLGSAGKNTAIGVGTAAAASLAMLGTVDPTAVGIAALAGAAASAVIKR